MQTTPAHWIGLLFNTINATCGVIGTIVTNLLSVKCTCKPVLFSGISQYILTFSGSLSAVFRRFNGIIGGGSSAVNLFAAPC